MTRIRNLLIWCSYARSGEETRTRIRWLPILLLAGWLVAMPTQVSAEYFIDVYGGLATTANETVSVEVNVDCGTSFPSLGAAFFPVLSALSGAGGTIICARQLDTRKVDFDSSFTVGGRLGRWSESYPWFGGAIDVSFFQADRDSVDILVVPLSFLLMLRWPLLVSNDFPTGRLQPYTGVGPSVFFANMEADLRRPVPFRLVRQVESFGRGVGFDSRVGLAWQVHPRVALFGEYRFTRGKLKTLSPRKRDGDGTIVSTIQTHHFLGGLSFRFQSTH